MEAIGTIIALAMAFIVGAWIAEKPWLLALLATIIGAIVWASYHAHA